ncbi:ABC transporter permease [Clostridium sp. 'deep sea']|uniref:ABC transporter permease n=1 Tax=Clostridium sp. 'deep sea' TaxID=2779445 RepID=UPI0018966CA9|nr:ABC transporter permease [Clostridium sp. 'deep sea']QOR36167.1 ABC transporter permease [Clostridium sp. 'deep sea']
MSIYIKKRLLGLIVVLIGVTILTFIFSNISEVDPAEAYAIRNILNPTESQIAEIREEMGLNLPIYKQYFNWVSQCLKGNLGVSLITKNAVSKDIAAKLPATLKIVFMAFVWILVLTIPVSILAAVHKNSIFDLISKAFTIIGISVPNYWLGFIFLMTFAVTIPLFKIVDYGNFKSLILPSLTLAIPIASSSIRLFRATILANINKDYVTYAKARGVSRQKIIWNHIVKNSLPPMITVFCQYFGYMIAGSAIVESVFSWPGIGTHLVNAIMGRDLPTINGCVLVIAVIFTLLNLFADLLNITLNPKMINEQGDI